MRSPEPRNSRRSSQLESRVRAAISGTAAEISPGSIPPLSLSDAMPPEASSWQPRHGRRTRRWQSRLLIPAGAAAAVIAVIAGSLAIAGGPATPAASTGHPGAGHRGGVTQPSDGASAGARPDAGVTFSPGQRAQLAARVIGFYFPATNAQFKAGAQFQGLQSALQNEVFAACMGKAGIQVPAQSIAEDAAGFFDNTQWPDMAAIARTGQLTPADDGAGPPAPPAGAASHRCGQASQRPFAALNHAVNAVSARWLNTFNAVAGGPQAQVPLAAMATCAQAHGVPATSTGSFNDLLFWAIGPTPPSTTRTGLAAERRHVLIFASCARDYIAVRYRLELAAQRAFLRTYQTQVGAVQTAAIQAVISVERRYGVPPAR